MKSHHPSAAMCKHPSTLGIRLHGRACAEGDTRRFGQARLARSWDPATRRRLRGHLDGQSAGLLSIRSTKVAARRMVCPEFGR